MPIIIYVEWNFLGKLSNNMRQKHSQIYFLFVGLVSVIALIKKNIAKICNEMNM